MEVARRSQTCRSKQQQRATRCRLAPVVEHYEAPESEDPELHPCVDVSSSSERAACHDLQKKAKSSMRILSKLRDAYVKLMNDIASGADFTGVAGFYGCPAATDYSVFMVAKSRPQEIQGDKAEHLQVAHPRHFSYIS